MRRAGAGLFWVAVLRADGADWRAQWEEPPAEVQDTQTFTGFVCFSTLLDCVKGGASSLSHGVIDAVMNFW